jgi:hypothetical protein
MVGHTLGCSHLGGGLASRVKWGFVQLKARYLACPARTGERINETWKNRKKREINHNGEKGIIVEMLLESLTLGCDRKVKLQLNPIQDTTMPSPWQPGPPAWGGIYKPETSGNAKH